MRELAGRGAAWTEERGTSDEGRRRPQAPGQLAGSRAPGQLAGSRAPGQLAGRQRAISGFHQDAEGDWVADLACLHSQHVRHNPPFASRPWVLDLASRQARVGTRLGCPLCDRAEMPAGLVLLRSAGPFDQDTLPAGLRRSHRIASGVWGRLRVTSGAVSFRLAACPPLAVELAAGSAQPIPPGMEHDLAVTGPVRLAVEFWGRAGVR